MYTSFHFYISIFIFYICLPVTRITPLNFLPTPSTSTRAKLTQWILIFQLKRTVSRLPTRTMIHVQISRTMKSRTGCTCPSTFLLFPPSFFPYKDRGIEEWLSPQLARKKVPLPHTFPHVQSVRQNGWKENIPVFFPFHGKNVENNYLTIHEK